MTLSATASAYSYDFRDAQPTDPEPSTRYKLDPSTIETQFRAYVKAFELATLFESSPERMKRRASFRAIVNLGAQAVPLLIDSIASEPSFLFLALEEIIGEDFTRDDTQGNLAAMSGAWQEWYLKWKLENA